MEKKTTAVYFLYRFFNDNPEATIEEGYEVYKQALKMEKEQIMMAVKDSWYMAKGSNFQDPQEEQYYKETYKSE